MARVVAPNYLIFDTDMGNDDAWALQMILKAEKQYKKIKVIAITIVDGNTDTENAAKNTYRLLDGLDRTDIPIHKGASEALIPGESAKSYLKSDFFHGSNGLNDVDIWLSHYPTDVNKIIQRKHAVDIIRDSVMNHPHAVSLICLGPLTNIALAIKIYPEIKDNIKDVFIMGGNIKGVGNITACAEFNIHMDPEAAHIVFNSLNCPKTIVPWECCIDESNIPVEWRFTTFENSKCKNIQLLNQIEQIAYKNYERFIPCDAYLTAAFLFPECVRKHEMYHVTVELHGNHTRGQMVLDHTKKKNHNAKIIQALHEEEFKKILHWTGTS